MSATRQARRTRTRSARLGAVVASIVVLGVVLVAPAGAADDPAVAVDASGGARFSWTRVAGDKFRYTGVIATRGLVGSTLGAPQDLTDPLFYPWRSRIGLAPDGTATVAWGGIFNEHPGARRRFPDGSLSPGLPFATLEGPMAVNSQGDAVFVGSVLVDCCKSALGTETLKADGTYTPSQALTRTFDTRAAVDPQVAVAPNGDATFVWLIYNGSSSAIKTRTRKASGALTAVQNLTVPGESDGQPRIAIDAGGDATFMWLHSNGTHLIAQTRRRAAAGSLGAVHDLSGVGRDATHPELAVAPRDDAAYTWQRSDGANIVAQARTRKPDGTFTPVKSISTTGQNANDADVAIDDAGNATFAWTRWDGTDTIAQARRRRASTGAFGPIQDLSGPGNDASQLNVAVAATGDAVFAWKRGRTGEQPCFGCTIQGRRLTPTGSLGPILSVGQ